MLNLPARLAERDRPVRVGLVGAGLFGTKFADQLERVDGMTLVAVADLDPEESNERARERADDALKALGEVEVRDETARDYLADLATFVVTREH